VEYEYKVNTVITLVCCHGYSHSYSAWKIYNLQGQCSLLPNTYMYVWF